MHDVDQHEDDVRMRQKEDVFANVRPEGFGVTDAECEDEAEHRDDKRCPPKEFFVSHGFSYSGDLGRTGKTLSDPSHLLRTVR